MENDRSGHANSRPISSRGLLLYILAARTTARVSKCWGRRTPGAVSLIGLTAICRAAASSLEFYGCRSFFLRPKFYAEPSFFYRLVQTLGAALSRDVTRVHPHPPAPTQPFPPRPDRTRAESHAAGLYPEAIPDIMGHSVRHAYTKSGL
jgi:hypothetical protein